MNQRTSLFNSNIIGILFMSLWWVMPAHAGFDERADVAQWLEKAADLGFEKAMVAEYLANTQANSRIIPILSNAPERKLVWSQYQTRLVTQSRIDLGRKFYKAHAAQLDLVTQDTGVDGVIIAAIAGLESDYGNNMGKHLTLQVLATLAFDYPRRSKFYQRQLAQFFRLCFEHGLDPTAVKGSAAGAVGMGQFIPTSYRDFAIDGDGDGRVDLFNSKADNIASIANYLAEHDWQRGQAWMLTPKGEVADTWVSGKAKRQGIALAKWQQRGLSVAQAMGPKALPEHVFNLYRFTTNTHDEYRLAGPNFYAITRYNHSLWYSRAVVEIAHGIAGD